MRQDGKEVVMLTLKEWTNDPNTMNNPTLLAIAGLIYQCEVRRQPLSSTLRPLSHGFKQVLAGEA